MFVTFMIISAEILFYINYFVYISSILIEAAASLIKTKSNVNKQNFSPHTVRRELRIQ